MILRVEAIALLSGTLATAALVIPAAVVAAGILRSWDPASGSELQIVLERRTRLVSAWVRFALAVEMLSFPFLVHAAETLHDRIPGAMCAAGVFNANGFGYPALLLKATTFLAAGLWLVIDHADRRGYDAPLLKAKYRLLVALPLPVLAATGLTAAFFLDLRGEVITSCCGSLFNGGGATVAAELAALPAGPTTAAFCLSAFAAGFFALRLIHDGSGALGLAAASAAVLVAAIAAIVSVFAPLVYELPHHHCPFCLLQAEYHHLGIPIYAALFTGTLCGLSCGALAPFRNRRSLKSVLPRIQKRLALGSLAGFGLLALTLTIAAAASAMHLPG